MVMYGADIASCAAAISLRQGVSSALCLACRRDRADQLCRTAAQVFGLHHKLVGLAEVKEVGDVGDKQRTFPERRVLLPVVDARHQGRCIPIHRQRGRTSRDIAQQRGRGEAHGEVRPVRESQRFDFRGFYSEELMGTIAVQGHR